MNKKLEAMISTYRVEDVSHSIQWSVILYFSSYSNYLVKIRWLIPDEQLRAIEAKLD